MSLIEKLVLWFVGLLVAGCIFILVAGIYYSAKSPKLVLMKSEWACVKTEPRVTTTTVLINNRPMPQTSVVDECVNYVKK